MSINDITINIEDDAVDVCKWLCWPVLIGDVTFNVEWRHIEGRSRTGCSPEEPAEIEIELCELIAIGNNSINPEQKNITGLDIEGFMETIVENQDIEAQLWEIHRDDVEGRAEYEAERKYESRL